MSFQDKPHHFLRHGEGPTSTITQQALKVLQGSLSTFSSAVCLQLEDLQRLKRLLDTPIDGNEKVEEVVNSLLVKSLIRPNSEKRLPQDQGPHSSISINGET